MTVKTRPDIFVKLSPVSTTYARSNGTSMFSNLGVRASRYTTEVTKGTARRKPKTKWLQPTPYEFERVEYRAAVGTSTSMPNGYPNSYGSKYVGVVGTVPGDTSTRFALENAINPTYSPSDARLDAGLRNAALIAARNKLKTSKVDLGVAYGERKQAAKHVGDTAMRLANSFKHLKRGNTRRAMDELGISSKRGQPRGSNVPKKWLEMQYAWKPMLSDVYGSVDSLAKRDRDDWRVTGTALKSTLVEKSGTYAYKSNGWGSVSVVCRKSVFVRIDCVPVNELLISLSSLGVLNPLNVGWELVPYSFVVDWFIPIGAYLDSLDSMLGYSCRGFSSSLLVRCDWTITGVSGSGSGDYEYINIYTGGKNMVHLNREAGTSTPIPTLPGFKDPRSLGHMANGLALLAGAFGRR